MSDPSLTEAPHPGKVLAERLTALQMSASELSRYLAIPVNRVTQIVNGQRGVTGDTALRLARFFGTDPALWLDLQKTYELRRAEEERGDEIRQTVPTLSGISNRREPPQRSLFMPGEAA